MVNRRKIGNIFRNFPRIGLAFHANRLLTFYLLLPENIFFNISCKLSPKDTLH